MASDHRLFKRSATGLLAIACAVLASGLRPTPVSAQAPDEAWRTIRTEHFRITFPEGLESLGRKAADRSERAWRELEAGFIEPPDGPIDILLTDHTDISNGFAQVTPSDRITIFARPPVDDLAIGYNDEWLELVLTHEIAHVVHLDHTRNIVGRVARSVFGRVSADWPFFPEMATPRWVVEGLATWYESLLTDAGRIRGTFLEMEIRTAVLEGRFENIGQASGESPLWPGGNRSYAYGSLFFEYLLTRHGADKMGAFVDAIAGQWIPYRLDAAGRDAFGVSLTDAWREWGDSLANNLDGLDARLSAMGPVTEPERLTFGARWGLHPATAPDGRWIAYDRSDGRSDTQIRLHDVTTGASHELGRTNGLATFSWTPQGDLIVAQLELADPYRSYSDVYRYDLDGGQHRITTGARVDQPGVSPDGARAVVVQDGGGTNGLAFVDLATGAVTPFVAPDPGANWAFPRFSPNGRWIAATRWEPGAYHDVVVLDARTGAIVDRVTRDRALDLAPAWSPDGHWLVWSSDRTGTLNILGTRMDPETGAASEPLLLTNVRTGAAYPSVDASGGWLYFSGYHVDGWEVERVPFRPDDARPAPSAEERFVATMAPPDRGEAEQEVVEYSALPTLAPTYWEVSTSDPLETPAVTRDSVFLRRRELLGFGVGMQSSGRDLVGRHAWSAFGRVTTSRPKFEGGASYSYAGLANPILSLAVRQGYEDGGQFAVEPDLDTLIILQRNRSIDGAVTVLAPRWRHDFAVSLSAGLEWQRRQLLDETLEPTTAYSLNRETVRLANYAASVSFVTARTHSFQMGTARGIGVSLFGGRSQELSVPDSLAGVVGADRSLWEVRGRVRGAVPLWQVGYARHVLAVQGSAGMARGPGASVLQYRVGGASGQSEPLTGFELFGGSFLYFPVRGYETSSRFGRNAWSASAEYRFPLWLVNRGFRAWPLHIDRAIGSVFFDAGNAWGPPLSPSGYENPLRTALASVGAEVTTEVLGLYDIALRLRVGFGVPLVKVPGSEDPRAWLRVGLPF